LEARGPKRPVTLVAVGQPPNFFDTLWEARAPKRAATSGGGRATAHFKNALRRTEWGCRILLARAEVASLREESALPALV
jgi:hypothetical protein